MEDAIFQTNPQGNLIYLNDAWEKITGFKTQECLHQKFESFVLPQDYEKYSSFLQSLLKNQRKNYKVEIRLINQKGGYQWVEIFEQQYITEQNNLMGTVGVIHNITQRKDFEGILIDVTKKLEKTIQKEIKFNLQYKIKEAELKQSETRLKQAQKLSGVGMWEWDIETDKVTWSDEMFRMYGISVEEFTGKGQDYLEYTHPEDRYKQLKNIQTAFEEAANLSSPLDFTNLPPKDFRIIRPDETICYVIGNAIPIVNKEGKPIRMLGILMDITQQKEYENNIEKLAMVAEKTNNLVFITDVNEKIEWANQALTPITGYILEEVIGKKPNEILQGEETDKNTLQKIRLAIQKREPIKAELINYTKSGKKYWIEVNIQPIFNKKNELVNFIAVEQDITERKNMEERFRLIFQSTDTAFVLVDTAGNIKMANPQAERLFQYSSSELIGQPLETLVPHEIAQKHIVLKNEYIKAPQIRQMAANREVFAQCKDGSTLPVSISLSYLTLQDETLILSSITDLSESKRKAFELEQLTQELIKKNDGLEQFNYIVSHNILSAVANILGLLGIYNHDDLYADINRTVLSHLYIAVDKLDEVIRDLNDVLEMQKTVHKTKEIIPIKDLVEDVCLSIQNDIEKTEAHIMTDFAVASISSIKSYIHSIVLNLLTNSLKYRHPERKPIIQIKTFQMQAYICLEVTDNGIGIDLKKYGHKIFELYSRAHIHIEGKGLGLFLVKKEIETLGGKIEVESIVNQGTTFRVYFPE
jgi:PAS domain S-box-containing protein